MRTLSEATGNSNLIIEIQREKRTTYFKENQSMGELCLKNDILCCRALTLQYL
jgi:hypothetical protein